MKKSNPKQRSIQWFARQDIYGFIYRSWMKNRGVPQDMFDGRPVIGICNTWSELTPCNTHFRVLADHVRHGVLVSGGPMLSGKYHGKDIGSGTNTWSMSEDLRAGKITLEEFHEAESCMHRSHGHCMTMGTASTMASMVEALGVALPGNAAYPAVDARRIGVELGLDDWDRVGNGVHTLVNLMPNGKYLMEDFCYAGGLPAVLRELGENDLLHKDAPTANGQSIWDNVRDAQCWNRDVIHTFKSPFKKNTGIAVLRGNLCPDGAIIKPSAATPKLMKHRGRAVVFENIEDFHRRIDD